MKNDFYAINFLVMIITGILSLFLYPGTYWFGTCIGAMSIGALNLCGALVWWDENSPINVKRIKKEVKEDNE